MPLQCAPTKKTWQPTTQAEDHRERRPSLIAGNPPRFFDKSRPLSVCAQIAQVLHGRDSERVMPR